MFVGACARARARVCVCVRACDYSLYGHDFAQKKKKLYYYLYAGADWLKLICRSEVGDSRSISPAKLCRCKVPIILPLRICIFKSHANMQTATIFVAVVVSPDITQAMWLTGLKAQTNYITVVVAFHG